MALGVSGGHLLCALNLNYVPKMQKLSTQRFVSTARVAIVPKERVVKSVPGSGILIREEVLRLQNKNVSHNLIICFGLQKKKREINSNICINWTSRFLLAVTKSELNGCWS